MMTPTTALIIGMALGALFTIAAAAVVGFIVIRVLHYAAAADGDWPAIDEDPGYDPADDPYTTPAEVTQLSGSRR